MELSNAPSKLTKKKQNTKNSQKIKNGQKTMENKTVTITANCNPTVSIITEYNGLNTSVKRQIFKSGSKPPNSSYMLSTRNSL